MAAKKLLIEKHNLKFLKIQDVIDLSSCSERHVREEISRRNLKAFKPGKELLFREEDVEKWILRKAVS